MMPRETDLNQN